MQKRSKQVLKDGRPRTRLRRSIIDRSRPGQQYKIRSPRIPSGREMEANPQSGYNALRRIRKKQCWKNPAEHDGGMPRGGKEAAKKCRLQETLEKMWASKTTASRRCGEDFGPGQGKRRNKFRLGAISVGSSGIGPRAGLSEGLISRLAKHAAM